MKRILASTTLILILGSIFYLSSCKSKKVTTSSTKCASSPTYTADIKPIFDASCMPCHSAEKRKHNIDVSSYASSKEAAKSKSLLGSIKHEVGYDAMPLKHDKLSDVQIEKVACWIQNGMPE